MATCSGCGAGDQPDGARFCFSCGTPLAAPTCTSCGAGLVPGARFCSECGAAQGATPAPPAGQPVSARRVTSVLFGDLVGFTSLSEHRDQEDTRELLTRYFDECRQIISRYGGTVEKFIGDAVMAVWGVPTAHEDDAERSVRAGLELVNMLAAMGQDLAVPDLAMRVGIVTGEVAVTIGAQQQGMVAGDAVNTASRVQSVAAPGQVWVDETTRLLTSSAITYVDVGSHPLKGKVDPVPLWSVRAVVAAVGGAQRADGLEAPLVGRERELRLIKEVFHGVEEGGGTALFLVDGEAGVGKSRLSWEFEKYVDGLNSSVRWHSGRCVSYGEGVAFFALAEAIRGRLRSLTNDDGGVDAGEDHLAELLEAGLDRYVPREEERTWLRPRIGVLLGIGSVGTYPREDLFAAWATFLERVGEGQFPVVLVIDDAQNADDGLLQFVEHLLSIGSFGCFVVLLTRPGLLERHPSLASNRAATVIHLGPLTTGDVSELLDSLVAGLPLDVRDELVQRSEGVPLFAVETVRSLIDRDLVIPRGGQYVLADADALDLGSIGAPASLQALISARLDALSPEQRRVVDSGSVLGAAFSREAIGALCAGLADLDAVLASLVRLQILSQESSRWSSEFGQYQFVQSVVRQVAYASLSRRDRKATHLAVVGRYEAQDDAAGDLAAIIAQHYLDAIEAVPGDADVEELEARAIGHLRRAAARARALGAPADAAGDLASALALAHDSLPRAEIESELALALLDAGRFGESIEHAISATDAFTVLGDPVAAGAAAATHAAALEYGFSESARVVEVAEPHWELLKDRDDALAAQLALVRVLCLANGRLGRNTHLLDQTRIRLAERSGDAGELADALVSLSVAYGVASVASVARILLDAAAELARQHHQPVSLARALLNLTVDWQLEDLRRAVDLGREAVSVARTTGVAVWISYAEINLLLALWGRGSWTEAIELLAAESEVDANISLVDGISTWLSDVRGSAPEPPRAGETPSAEDRGVAAWAKFDQALRARRRGDLVEAARLGLEASEGQYEVAGLWDDFWHVWPDAVETAIEAADDATLARLMEMVDSGTQRVPEGLQAHRLRFAGLLAIRDGGPAEVVEDSLRRAITRFEQWGAMPYRARAEAELGSWLVAEGRPDEAEPFLASAREAFTALGAQTWLDRMEAALALVR